MATLSTHVLDTATGLPAGRVAVLVESLSHGEWAEVGAGTTDDNGRVVSLASDLSPGTYRLVFATGEYGNTFFPMVPIVVELDDPEAHYHIPLLLSPFGYSTYRGS